MNAQCSVGKEKFPGVVKNCDNSLDELAQAYGEFVSCFGRLAKGNDL